MRVTRHFGLALAIVAAALLASPAGAYYHYVHYLSRNGPFVALQEKFDYTNLPNKTVTVFVSDSGPSAYTGTDSFASVLSQVRQAALAWNSVDSSDLRVSFGGTIQGTSQPNTPGVQVIFGELQPGVLGFTVQTAAGGPSNGPNGPFVPIQRSITTFRRDLTQHPGPSYLESFFTTAVHEMGHALGLQHTFTSSAMTVSVNRNINRARPLDADDIAGVSLLYPKAGYFSTVGAIAGRVTSNGQGVNLASVVALRPAGAAISTLTNPDGTYRLDGLPPDTYYIYVHPLPLDAAIRLPVDLANQPFAAPGAFETLFYPGTRTLTQFAPINVSRGNTVSGIDFSVAPRSAPPVYQGSTYSYIGDTALQPAFVNSNSALARFVFSSLPSTPVPTSALILGVGDLNIVSYGTPVNLALDIRFPLGSGTGPRHLIMNLGNDMFVLPSAVNLVQKQPPLVGGALPQGDGTVQVAGSNMGPDSRVFFDGLPAAVRTPFSGNDAAGSVVVTPPPGFSGQRSIVTVYNGDGQNSMQLQSQNPPVYSYDVTDPPQIQALPNSLTAGSSALIDITGINTRFVDGQVTVGFGTNDVYVRRVWVLGPNHIVANVSVAPNAVLGASEISVISGFQTINLPFAFFTQPQNPRLPSVALPIVNAIPGQVNLFPGATVTLFGNNLALSSTSAAVTLNDSIPAQILFAAPNQINFVIPPNTPPGFATLKLNNGSDNAFPVGLQIDSQPPVIAAVTTLSNQPVDASRALSTGEVLNLMVAGLDPAIAANPARIRVTISGIEMPVTQIQPAGQGGFTQLQIVVTQSFGGQQAPLTVSQDGTVSNPFAITIR